MFNSTKAVKGLILLCVGLLCGGAAGVGAAVVADEALVVDKTYFDYPYEKVLDYYVIEAWRGLKEREGLNVTCPYVYEPGGWTRERLLEAGCNLALALHDVLAAAK